jgi:hypothetical protein
MDWDGVADAIFHLGSGSGRDLDKLALQLETDEGDETLALTDSLARTMEVLGHIEVQREPGSGRVIGWTVNSPMAAEVGERRHLLVGSRSAQFLRHLEAAIESRGGKIERQPEAMGPTSVVLTGLTSAELADVMRQQDGPVGSIEVVADAATRMVAALPVFSEVVLGLPSVGMPVARSMKRWDPGSALWIDSQSADSPGAYKLAGFSVRYLLRDAVDIRSGKASPGDARVVKHAAALSARVPLAAYLADQQCLVLPIGADLPGLYGRAVVLASGRLPVPSRRDGTIMYPGVAEPIATGVLQLLAG